MPTAVSVLYPREPGATFNESYYLTSHVALIEKLWRSNGLQSYRVVKYANDAPYTYSITMDWDSLNSWDSAARSAGGKEVMADVARFSSVEPTLVVGEVLGV